VGWNWSLNWGEITPRIVIGTCPITPGDLGRIKAEASASAVLSLQHNDCLAYWRIDYSQMQHEAQKLELTMRRCPIRDFDIRDMQRWLPDAVALLAGLQTAGHRTYVHCTAGLGRAPLVVLGYLTLVERATPDQAISQILEGRPRAVPAWEALHGARADLIAQFRRSIERVAYELYEQCLNTNGVEDWYQAEAEVLRSVLSNWDPSDEPTRI
jgi:hypothetical protein